MRSASELLSLLNLADSIRTPQHEQQIAELLKTTDLGELLKLARQNSAVILTAKNLSAHGISFTEEFSALAKKLTATGEKRVVWIEKVLAAATKAGIQVVLLKGGLLGSVVYNDPAYKKMNDLDVLVRWKDAERFGELLKTLSFNSVGKLLGEKEFSEKSHHSPPFVSPDLACVIGLHWGLVSPYSVWKPAIEDVWLKTASVHAYGTTAYRMSWEHNLLHLCIHLPFFKVGVRELADVYNLVLFASSKGEFDWQVFDQAVHEWRAPDAAYRVLALAEQLVAFGLPKELLQKWKAESSIFTRRDTEVRLGLGTDLVATRSVHIGKIEKAFTVFRLSQNYGERVGAWAMTWVWSFYPPRQEVAALLGKLPESLQPLDRIRVLGHSWKAMARDYGNIALTLITCMNLGMVLRDTILFPLRKNGPKIRTHPAAKLLEMLE